MATLPAAPSDCTFDSLGLFTHGQFRCFQSQNACLSLFTHGEFPRGLADVAVGGPGGQPPGVGNARQQRRYKPPVEVVYVCDDEEAIILSLLLAEDDEWW